MIHNFITKNTHKHNKEMINTARLHGPKNGRLSTCLLKACLAHERSAARWRNAKNIHLKAMFLMFNISDQGPKKLPKWVSGISKRAFPGQAEGQEMPKDKYWEFQNQHFWASAQEMPNMSSGIGHWKCWKWISEASKRVLPNHVRLNKAREMFTNNFRC